MPLLNIVEVKYIFAYIIIMKETHKVITKVILTDFINVLKFERKLHLK